MSEKQTRQKHRIRLWTEQGGKCIFCKRNMWIAGVHIEGKSSHQATLEHIIPKSQGGSNLITNLVCSCFQCNHRRRTLPFNTYKTIRSLPNYFHLLTRIHDTKRNKPIGFFILQHMVQLKQHQIKRMVKNNERISAQIVE